MRFEKRRFYSLTWAEKKIIRNRRIELGMERKEAAIVCGISYSSMYGSEDIRDKTVKFVQPKTMDALMRGLRFEEATQKGMIDLYKRYLELKEKYKDYIRWSHIRGSIAKDYRKRNKSEKEDRRLLLYTRSGGIVFLTKEEREEIRLRRLSLGLDYKHAAEVCNVSDKTIKHLETGRHNPYTSTMRKILDGLGIE